MSFALVEPATFTGEVHPYADRWPMRPADEIEEMAESIRSRRQRLPIVLTPEGVLVDGRNRLRACELSGVTPWFEVDDTLTTEDEITAYIWDANGDRRNLSKGQRAMLAALRPGSALLLSSNTGASRQYIDRARQVIQWCDTDVVERVIGGTLPLNDAYTQAQQIKATEQADEIERKRREKAERERAAREAAQLDDLRANDPKRAAAVDGGHMALADALRLRAEELAKDKRRRDAAEAADRQFVADIRAAFAAISMLKHDMHFERLVANYTPGPQKWTTAELHELADLLHARADEWNLA